MFKKILLTAGSLLAGLVLLWAVLAWAGVCLPINFLRAGIENGLNQDLAPLRVELKGALYLAPAWGLDLRARDLMIFDPRTGDSQRPVARVKELDLKLSLAPLFWGELDVERVIARQFKLKLTDEGGGLIFPQVEGRLNFTPEAMRLEEMLIVLGASRLTGRASLRAGKPPFLEVELDSPHTDLEDVYAVAGLDRPRDPQSLAKSRSELLRNIDRSVRGAFGALEGRISLKARELRMRGALLGRASLRLSLKGDRLALDPVYVELPGGRIELSDEMVRQGSELASELNLSVRNFSYGLLLKKGEAARRDAGGRLSLRIALSTRAPRMDQFLSRADGIIQVGIWPKDLKDQTSSLWAANLIFGLLNSLTKHYNSKVNCAIADLVMEKGVLTQRKLIIDTSKLRVSGEAKINFVRRTINVELSPRAKTPQFFSLETPISIQGGFDDFSAGVAPGGMVGSVIKFATSPIFAPLRRLFGDTLPKEGKDVCLSPATWPPPVADQGQGKPKADK